MNWNDDAFDTILPMILYGILDPAILAGGKKSPPSDTPIEDDPEEGRQTEESKKT